MFIELKTKTYLWHFDIKKVIRKFSASTALYIPKKLYANRF